MTTRLLALALLPFGCGDGDAPTEGVACTHNSDCEGQQRCIDSTCRDEVETTTDSDGAETAETAETTTDSDGADTTTGADYGGDPCELGGNVCLDENTLGTCNVADQSTTPLSCDDACASMGFSTAIGCSVATEGKHQCYCDQASATCTESSCGGGLALAECIGGMLSVTDCNQECQAQGLPGDCGYDQQSASYFCNCIGPYLCTEGATFCQDPLTEMRCMNGVWQPQPCSDQACHMKVCLDEFQPPCPADYQAQTLGCWYDSYYGETGCLCTS